MKKIILTLLISSISLTSYAKPNYSYTINQTPAQTQYNTQGVYVNEEITTPISQIGVPEHYLQPQVEEKGLEIEWNEWHANLRNYVMKKQFFSNIPNIFRNNALYSIVYTVHKNGQVSDVIVAEFKENEDEIYKITVNNNEKPRFNSKFIITKKTEGKDKYKNYIYKMRNYNIYVKNDSPIVFMKKSTFIEEVSFWDKVLCEEIYITDNIAKNIEKLSGNPILKFPEKSERDKVIVIQFIACGLTIPNFKKEYTPSEFNDIERIN